MKCQPPQDAVNPHACLVEGDFILRRDPSLTESTDDFVLQRRYDLLGMGDLFLDFAGRKRVEDTVHKHLAKLKPGDPLFANKKGDFVELCDENGTAVAQLAQIALKTWRERLDCIEKITVLAMVQRRAEDSADEYRPRCQCEQWEVPVAEIVYHNHKNRT